MHVASTVPSIIEEDRSEQNRTEQRLLQNRKCVGPKLSQPINCLLVGFFCPDIRVDGKCSSSAPDFLLPQAKVNPAVVQPWNLPR